MSDVYDRLGAVLIKHGIRWDSVVPPGSRLIDDLITAFAGPIPMRLLCPACAELHVDEGDFATKVHHTHACQHCGNVWRPAVCATVGVRFLPGFKNEGTPT